MSIFKILFAFFAPELAVCLRAELSRNEEDTAFFLKLKIEFIISYLMFPVLKSPIHIDGKPATEN